jgi:hypothetical protein
MREKFISVEDNKTAINIKIRTIKRVFYTLIFNMLTKPTKDQRTFLKNSP